MMYAKTSDPRRRMRSIIPIWSFCEPSKALAISPRVRSGLPQIDFTHAKQAGRSRNFSAESRPYSRQGRSARHFRSPQGHGIWEI